MPGRNVHAGMGAGMESVSSSMGFSPMNSEAFAGNFADACAEPHEPLKRAQATAAESAPLCGQSGQIRPGKLSYAGVSAASRALPNACTLASR